MKYVGPQLDIGDDPRADALKVPTVVQQDATDQGRTIFVQFSGDPAPSSPVRGDVRVGQGGAGGATDYPLLLTRTSASGRLMFGAGDTATAQLVVASNAKLALSDIDGGFTPSTVNIANVTAATATTGGFYVVAFNLKPEDGLPGTLAASWGPFGPTTGSSNQLTSQTTAMPSSGRYWVGYWGNNALDGSITFEGWVPTRAMFGNSDERNLGLAVTTPTDAPSDLSSTTGFALDRFIMIPNVWGA